MRSDRASLRARLEGNPFYGSKAGTLFLGCRGSKQTTRRASQEPTDLRAGFGISVLQRFFPAALSKAQALGLRKRFQLRGARALPGFLCREARRSRPFGDRHEARPQQAHASGAENQAKPSTLKHSFFSPHPSQGIRFQPEAASVHTRMPP